MNTVLILANSSAGLYDFRRELLEALLNHGSEVIVSVPDTVKTDELTALGCSVVQTKLSRHGTNPVAEYRLYRDYLWLLDRYRPDMVLTYTVKPNLYGALAAKRRRIPYIVTVTGLGAAFRRGGLVRRYVGFMYRRSLAGASCVFFQNEANKSLFETEGLLGGRGRVVAGSGVNLETFPAEPYPQDEAVRFLFVGRMMRDKGIEEYLQAARALHDAHTHFYIVGYADGDCGDLLKAAEEEGSVSYLGFHKDVHPFYRAMSAVVLPSYHEGMSNVLLEGAATGRPLIATDISGCREIVENGKNGFLCAPEDAPSLIRALQSFLSLTHDARAAMGAQARIQAEQYFDRKKVVEAYMEEIRNGIV